MAYGSDLGSMTYLGLMGLLDPPRIGVPEALRVLAQSGVSVKMLTGDSRETAVSIGNFYCCQVSFIHLSLSSLHIWSASLFILNLPLASQYDLSGVL